MNEEEIEAIEYIKELIKPPLREEWDFAYKLDKTTAKQFKTLLNYIDKLQKENEGLSQSNFLLLEINQKLVEEKPIIKELTENNLSYREELAKAWKENKELKTAHRKNGRVLFTIEAINERYVSKDKIRDKLNHAKEVLENLDNEQDMIMQKIVINYLKELLGETKDEE